MPPRSSSPTVIQALCRKMLQTKMLHVNVPPQFHCGCKQNGNSELILASGCQIAYDPMHVTLQRLTMLALLKAFGQEDTQILPSVPLGVKTMSVMSTARFGSTCTFVTVFTNFKLFLQPAVENELRLAPADCVNLWSVS